MKRTSTNSSKRRTRKPERVVKTSALTEEDRVLAFLKEKGFRPMTIKEKQNLAAAGCLGMPDE